MREYARRGILTESNTEVKLHGKQAKQNELSGEKIIGDYLKNLLDSSMGYRYTTPNMIFDL